MSSPDRPTIPFAPTLEVPGANMHLRLSSVDGAEAFAAMCREGGEALARFVPQVREFTSVEGARDHLEIVERLMAAGSAMYYNAVESPPEDANPPFGRVALRGYVPTASSALLGGFMLPAYWGQGLARQTVETVLEYAGRREVWSLKKVLAKAAIDNERSERGLRRLGFQVSGEPFIDEEGLRATGVKQTVRMWSRPL